MASHWISIHYGKGEVYDKINRMEADAYMQKDEETATVGIDQITFFFKSATDLDAFQVALRNIDQEITDILKEYPNFGEE